MRSSSALKVSSAAAPACSTSPTRSAPSRVPCGGIRASADARDSGDRDRVGRGGRARGDSALPRDENELGRAGRRSRVDALTVRGGFAAALLIAGASLGLWLAAAGRLPDCACARAFPGKRAHADAERRSHRSDCRDGRAGQRTPAAHQRPPDVINGLALAALHASARAHSAACRLTARNPCW